MRIACQHINGENPITFESRPECWVTTHASADDSDMSATGIVMSDGRVMVCMILPDLGSVPADTGNISGNTVASNVRKAMNAARGLV